MREELIFASVAWVDAARDILEELASQHGEPGRKYSCCERFTDAPAELSATGIVAWHFRIDGTAVTVQRGDVTDVDLLVTADYAATLPMARLIYTPEILAQQQEEGPPPHVTMEGDRSKSPPYLIELHNRLAAVTA
jgi:hypothetical protein